MLRLNTGSQKLSAVNNSQRILHWLISQQHIHIMYFILLSSCYCIVLKVTTTNMTTTTLLVLACLLATATSVFAQQCPGSAGSLYISQPVWLSGSVHLPL